MWVAIVKQELKMCPKRKRPTWECVYRFIQNSDSAPVSIAQDGVTSFYNAVEPTTAQMNTALRCRMTSNYR